MIPWTILDNFNIQHSALYFTMMEENNDGTVYNVNNISLK
jgi:hypothetical protein